jgi:hypothetical protein
MDGQVFYASLHEQVFLNAQKWQQDVFVAIIGSLEVHFVIELVLDDGTATALNVDEIPGYPLPLANLPLEIASLDQFLQNGVLILKAA